MKKKTPAMQLSLEWLEGQGKVAGIVERRIPITIKDPAALAKFGGRQPSKLKDLWNIFDICYLDPELKQVGFVQTTSWAARKSHIEKMEAEAATMFTLAQVPGVVTELHAWQRDDRGHWQIKVWRTTIVRREHSIHPDAVLTEWAMPSMKEVRAQAREREKLQESQAEGEDAMLDEPERRIIRR